MNRLWRVVNVTSVQVVAGNREGWWWPVEPIDPFQGSSLVDDGWSWKTK